MELRDLVIMNDGINTFGDLVQQGSFLDLALISASMGCAAECWTSEDSYGSDHRPVLMTISIEHTDVCETSNRLRMNKVN